MNWSNEYTLVNLEPVGQKRRPSETNEANDTVTSIVTQCILARYYSILRQYVPLEEEDYASSNSELSVSENAANVTAKPISKIRVITIIQNAI